VDARQHVVHRIEDFAAIGRRDAGHLGIGQDAAGQELHDVERGADHKSVLAQGVGFRHRHIGMIRQSLDDAIFAIHLVRRGQELARRLLAQHVHAPATVGQVEGRVALPALELEHGEGTLKAVDVGLHVVDEMGLVEDMRFADGREVSRAIRTSVWRLGMSFQGDPEF
jgi:hypothetical protein